MFVLISDRMLQSNFIYNSIHDKDQYKENASLDDIKKSCQFDTEDECENFFNSLERFNDILKDKILYITPKTSNFLPTISFAVAERYFTFVFKTSHKITLYENKKITESTSFLAILKDKEELLKIFPESIYFLDIFK